MTVDEEMNYERNQFVIRYNNMKGKYCTSPYSGYDYKTCGSILHYLYLYCGLRYAVSCGIDTYFNENNMKLFDVNSIGKVWDEII